MLERVRVVLAEDAVKHKRFQDAADLYGRALGVAPWWPDGHFDRALILGELHEYTAAADEMQRYVALVPDAPDARAARDKIYIWQHDAQTAISCFRIPEGYYLAQALPRCNSHPCCGFLQNKSSQDRKNQSPHQGQVKFSPGP